MIITSMHIAPTPTANQANASTSAVVEQGSLFNKIVDTETRVRAAEAWSNSLNNWVIGLGVAYLVITAAFVAASLMAIPAGNKLRADEKSLSELRIEQERQRTLQLWKDVAPREISDQSGMLQALRPFRGTKFAIFALADVEASQTGEQIYAVLGDVPWELVKAEKTIDDIRFMNGVLIQTGDVTDRALNGAADTLAAELERNNIKTIRIAYNENDVRVYGLPPEPIVLIKVGFKPFPQPPGGLEPTPIEKGTTMRGNRRRFPASGVSPNK